MLYPLKRGGQVSQDRYDFEYSSGKVAGINDLLTDPFLVVDFQRDFTYRGVEFIPYFSLKISPFDINLEGTLIIKVQHPGLSQSKSVAIFDPELLQVFRLVEDVLKKTRESPLSAKRKLFFPSVPLGHYTPRSTLGWSSSADAAMRPRSLSRIADATAVLQTVISEISSDHRSGGLDAGTPSTRQAARPDQSAEASRRSDHHTDCDFSSQMVVQGLVYRSLAKASPPHRPFYPKTVTT